MPVASRHPRAGYLILNAVLSLSVSGTLSAAESIPATDALDEVVVTATRRTESLQDVPLAVSAMGTRQLEQLGARNFEDFLRLVPGVTLNTGAANNSNFSMRGLATETSNANLQPTVALYINDLPTVDPSNPLGFTDLPAFDVERVEVLRGPQGTLFGSGSLGGTIRIITNKPLLNQTQGKIELRAAGTERGEPSGGASGMLNLPVGDTLAFRAVIDTNRTGGVIDNIVRGVRNADRVDATSARLAALWAPISSVRVIGTFLYNDSNPKDNTLANDNSPVLGSAVVNGRYETNSLAPEYTHNRDKIGNIEVDVDLPWATLFSSTTYGEKSLSRSRDFGEIDSPISLLYQGAALPSNELTTLTDKTFAQELRLASVSKDPFSWLAGAFYVQRKGDIAVIEGDPGYVGSGFERPGTGNLVDYRTASKSTEIAGFGEIAYRFDPAWRLALSGRLFRAESQVDASVSWAFGPGIVGLVKTADTGFTPRVVLEFKPRDSVLTYVSYSRGYRVGGPNLALPGLPPTFEPDTVDAYELGAKTQWLDRRLTLNVAAFRNQWKDIQINEILNGLAALTNGPKAHSQGVELEVVARPISALTLNLSLALTDAKIDADAANINADRGGIRSGDRLPGVAGFTGSVVARYDHAITASMDGYLLLADSYFSGAYNGFDRTNPLVKASPAWNKLDLRGGLTIGRYEVVASIENLLHADALTNVQYNGGFQRDGLARLRPRTVGLTLRASF